MFDPLVARLEHSYRMLVPDLAGHGESRGVRGPYRARDLAADVVDVMNAADVGRAAVLGYSQGGPVALQTAHDWPERIDRLIMACSYAHNTDTALERLQGYILSGLLATLGPDRALDLLIKPGVGGGDPLRGENFEFFRDVIRGNTRRAAIASAKLMRTYDGRALLPAIKAPTLIICGADDKAVPPHHARMLAEGIPDARVETLAGGGHLLIYTHGDEFESLLRSFLPQPTGRTAAPA